MNGGDWNPPAWAWPAFAASVVVLIAVDLLAHRGHGADSPRRATFWSIFWIALAFAFAGALLFFAGPSAAESFVGAYLLEKSLSVDNLFVFLLVFDRLRIEPMFQRKVLSWGIIGALVFRALFIALGAALLVRFHVVAFVFGALLLLTAAKTLRDARRAPEGGEGGLGARLLGRLERVLPWAPEVRDGRFFVRIDGRTKVTPLALALITIELSDVVFAIDSIPAAFAVTESPFLVYTSNVFAVLGLRSLYIVLSRALHQLRYLRYGLSAVLAFAGLKLIASRWIHLPPLASVLIIVACIGTAISASLSLRAASRVNP